jgi:hybrid cluster-associated redox disulfide protein
MSRPDLRDPDLTIRDLMDAWPETVPVFIRHRMLCVGCAITPFHTVVEACKDHMVDELAFREALAAAVGSEEHGPSPPDAARSSLP